MGLGGVWTLDTLEDEFEKLPEEERKKALHAQIAYHKKVLNAKGNAHLFNKSSGGTEYTTEKLKSNFSTILDLNNINSAIIQAGKLQYHTKESVSRKSEQSKTEMMDKIITQRNNITAKQQKQLLPCVFSFILLFICKKSRPPQLL